LLGALEVISLLTAAGADVNAQNEMGATPLLSLLCSFPQAEVLAHLLSLGADAR